MYNIINIEARILAKKIKDKDNKNLEHIEKQAANYLISGQE